MTLKPHNPWNVLKDTFANWTKHDATTHSAALAYYALFAIGPILILVISASGWAFGVEAARGQVQRDLSLFIGSQGAGVVQDLVVSSSSRPRTGRLAAIVGAVTLLVTATGALMQLQDTLNTVWEVSPKPGFFLKRLLLKRLLCFGLILGVGLLVLASLAASAGLTALQKVLESRLEVGLSKVLGWGDVTLSWLLMTVLIAVVFRILPDVELSWRDVAWGSAFTSVLFLAGRDGIGFYLGRTGVTSTYGAAGSLVLVILWIYYSSLIFLLGAEFTRVHSRRYREGLAQASPGAERTATVKVPLEATQTTQS
ncbi:MAG TPA: YihY/virulence factor BrkB family protein [Thermoanaerobaculia bacterium]|jgi:membrane protein|nr:YihY/virulence factor BrkB family protein [Thermoanaerobaculia bacterium]